MPTSPTPTYRLAAEAWIEWGGPLNMSHPDDLETVERNLRGGVATMLRCARTFRSSELARRGWRETKRTEDAGTLARLLSALASQR